jgi:hypothetical protein
MVNVFVKYSYIGVRFWWDQLHELRDMRKKMASRYHWWRGVVVESNDCKNLLCFVFYKYSNN